MAEILVVGGALLDTLHFSGRSQESAGGAGMYTALAAQRSVDPFCAHRKELLQPVIWTVFY